MIQPSSPNLTILHLDGHPSWADDVRRELLAGFQDFDVSLQTLTDHQEFLVRVAHLKPELAVLDEDGMGSSGQALIFLIRRLSPRTVILALASRRARDSQALSLVLDLDATLARDADGGQWALKARQTLIERQVEGPFAAALRSGLTTVHSPLAKARRQVAHESATELVLRRLASGRVTADGSQAEAGLSTFHFDRLVSLLFVQVLRRLGQVYGRLSVRQLERHLGLSKSTISRKICEAFEQGVATPEELSGCVRITSRMIKGQRVDG